MHFNQKSKSALSFAALILFCTASLSAYQINLTVNDRELEFPLEGVKVTVKNSDIVNSETDADGNVTVEIPESVESGKILLSYPGYGTEELAFTNSTISLFASLISEEQ